MYKLLTTPDGKPVPTIRRTIDGAFIPFAPGNTDYANFKKEVLEGAELQDADGNVLIPSMAKDFVNTLP